MAALGRPRLSLLLLLKLKLKPMATSAPPYSTSTSTSAFASASSFSPSNSFWRSRRSLLCSPPPPRPLPGPNSHHPHRAPAAGALVWSRRPPPVVPAAVSAKASRSGSSLHGNEFLELQSLNSNSSAGRERGGGGGGGADVSIPRAWAAFPFPGHQRPSSSNSIGHRRSFSTSDSPLYPGNAEVLVHSRSDLTAAPSNRSSGNAQAPSSAEVGGGDRNEGEASPAAGSASSSRKGGRRTCYYHSQGLCTMEEDAAHLAKFSHEFPDLSVRKEDLKKVKQQPFDYFLVLDLEGMVEILEFPVVMIDAKTLQVIDRFHRFVRPAKMTEARIVEYIRNKYGRWGLDRVWHDTAIPFTDVLALFETWLQNHGLWEPQDLDKRHLKQAAFVTCGNWDVKTKIPEQCATSEIKLPAYFNEWINLKDIYCNFYKFKASGMLKMMKGLQIPVVGTHHVGLDDAHNIARVLQRMLAHGAVVQLTAKRSLDDPKAVKFTFRFRIK